MKLQNVKDVRKLFEVVDSCKGKVELVFKDGVPEIPEMEIVAYDPEDVQKLFNFMVNG